MKHSIGPAGLDPNWLVARFDHEMLLVATAVAPVEWGLLFSPLPGDSPSFNVGLFIRRAGAGHPGLPMKLGACLALSAAGLAGNVTGDEAGRVGDLALYRQPGRYLKPKRLHWTEVVFDRHGSKALALGRFVPEVRTFLIVVAGVSGDDRRRAFTWSLVCAVSCASGATVLGGQIGRVDLLQGDIAAVLIVVVVMSMLPALAEWIKHRRTETVVAK